MLSQALLLGQALLLDQVLLLNFHRWMRDPATLGDQLQDPQGEGSWLGLGVVSLEAPLAWYLATVLCLYEEGK